MVARLQLRIAQFQPGHFAPVRQFHQVGGQVRWATPSATARHPAATRRASARTRTRRGSRLRSGPPSGWEAVVQQDAVVRHFLLDLALIHADMQPVAGGQELRPPPAGAVDLERGLGGFAFQPDEVSGHRRQAAPANQRGAKGQGSSKEVSIVQCCHKIDSNGFQLQKAHPSQRRSARPARGCPSGFFSWTAPLS